MGTRDTSRPFGRHEGRWGNSGGPLRPIFADESGHPGTGRRCKPDYKTEALCKLVRRVTGMTLSGECADPILQSLIVDEVHPAPNAGRLLLRVLARLTDGGANLAEVLGRLEKVKGLLRTRIAEATARKRTPELCFDVILLAPPPSAPPESEPRHE